MPAPQVSDLDLVSQCLAGNRNAFAQVVARYQTLICSLAYSATGNLSQSQELSQETFVLAWTHLPELREPGKLRSWLCAIVRNQINKTLGRQGRDPVHAAEPLEAAHATPSPDPLPSEQAITREEEAILWRSLESIPELYREPLVLFYREHQSIEKVAIALELTEDAVKQRLSRGRKLLHEQVLSFIEDTLEKTAPGQAFLSGVLAALPTAAASAKAAALGTALATGGSAARHAASFGSLLVWLAVLGGFYASSRAQIDDTKSPRERQFILQMIGLRIVAILLVGAAFFGAMKFGSFHTPFAYEIFYVACVTVGTFILTGFIAYSSRRRRTIQIEDGTFVAAEWSSPRKETDSVANQPGDKSKYSDKYRVWRFIAIALGFSVMIVARAPSIQHVEQGAFMLALMSLFYFWLIRNARNFPHYQCLSLARLARIPANVGVITLLVIDLHQYQLYAFSHAVTAAPLSAVIFFNIAVVLVYALFIGILLWKGKHRPAAPMTGSMAG